MASRFFAGEAEDRRLDDVLRDAWAGTLAPLYNHMDDLPSLQGEPPPILPQQHVRRTSGSLSSIDLGRGCPYQCSFCTIINVQGRKSRFRSPDDLEQIIRDNVAQGIKRFFITDDNFARNRHWEPLFDRMIALREEGLNIGFTIQVDTLCHRIPNFIDKAGRAGVRRVFIGLENINPENLLAREEAAEPHHRVPRHAAGVARGRRHHLCRLHHRLSRRHQGIDPARCRDHQARTAAGHPGVLLPHAAAGIGGPQGAVASSEPGWTPT